MISQEELEAMLQDIEADNIEKTISLTANDKFGEAICAFANDLPNHQKNGYLIIGVQDDNTFPNKPLDINDRFLQELANFGTDGRIQPRPTISVNKFIIKNNPVVVVEVSPATYPPVRYKGKVHIRIGTRKATASEADERILSEKRTSKAKTFDTRPCEEASLEDLVTSVIKISYLPTAIDAQILEANHRDFTQQLASLRLYDLKNNFPTYASILFFGNNPKYFVFGAFVQYLKINSTQKELENVVSDKVFSGNLFDTLPQIDSFIKNNIIKTRPVRLPDSFKDEIVHNYLYDAMRELVMNAIMHRDYESNAPINIYHFLDRVEIHNAGGLYGRVNAKNFPNENDYRNPVIAEVMKNLGYVNRFNFGIASIKNKLKKLGEPMPVFDLGNPNSFCVTLKINPKWQNE